MHSKIKLKLINKYECTLIQIKHPIDCAIPGVCLQRGNDCLLQRHPEARELSAAPEYKRQQSEQQTCAMWRRRRTQSEPSSLMKTSSLRTTTTWTMPLTMFSAVTKCGIQRGCNSLHGLPSKVRRMQIKSKTSLFFYV